MGPLSYMRSVVDRNVVMRRMTIIPATALECQNGHLRRRKFWGMFAPTCRRWGHRSRTDRLGRKKKKKKKWNFVARISSSAEGSVNTGVTWASVGRPRVCCKYFFLRRRDSPPVGQGLLITEDSLSHSDTPQSVGLLWTSDQSDTWQHTALRRVKHPCPGGIRTHNPSKRADADPRL